jgi:uncharacterized protein
VIASLAVFAGAAVQRTTGLGFALVCAPVLAATLGPRQAVASILVLGVEINVLTLAARRERPRPLRDAALGVGAFALPGLVLGAVVLTNVPERALSALLCAAVLAGIAAQVALKRRTSEPQPPPSWALPAAGLSAGALTTTTGTNGPPMALYLLRRRATPTQLRDTLALLFLALSLAGGAVLLIGDGLHVPDVIWALLLGGLAGHELGRVLAGRIDARRHENAVLAVLLLTAIVAGAAAIAR